MLLTPGVSVEQSKPRARVRAPELTGDAWWNTGGEPLTLAGLRGKIVLLDFWTSGCVNCLHVLDELRPLEEEFADVLVTVGVHSPKFVHEGGRDSVAAAVARLGVDHPVVSDPDMSLWQQYAVKAWPTLVVVDPEGYVVHVAAGEGHGDALRRVIGELVALHERNGTLRRGETDLREVARADTDGRGHLDGLRFPSKAVVTAEGRVLVADTANHSVAEFASDAETLLRRFGDGRRGAVDGAFDVARFAEPSGLTLLPTHVADEVGYHLLVADTANHLLRGVDLRTGAVRTVAGTGRQWRDGDDSGPALGVDLTSPWDVRWWDAANGVVVAMAGNHTLSLFDPVEGTISRFAGTTVEGLRDASAAEAFFAQTSGLAVTGERLWLVDAETSALRYVERDGGDAGDAGGFVVRTAVGQDLFTFGHRDGAADSALFQHPLGVTVLPDGAIGVADTYNGAVRRFDPVTGEVTTLLRDLAEPSGLVVTDGGVLVVESAAHRLRPLERGGEDGLGGEVVDGAELAVRRPPTVLAPGQVRLAVTFVPPPGEKLDDRYGPSTRLEVSASPPELLLDGGGVGTELERTVTLADGVEGGVLQVVAQAASCASDAEHPVCRITRQDWGVPVRVESGGAAGLPLVMAGTPAE
ncbi:NHL domain-containing thioredoxin family protein [Saccharomonospora cyanea]|uniref:Thiol-disulfide isomerase-like thioredoxin n=1 Tax=Saccharomonospora cyanea NA-134 TaxID=882082 RepID=H5XQF2_9PSEU|nr:thiol-disulfide isomerase-like thioredoxin [Saccharomonospora cyanea NA-134]